MNHIQAQLPDQYKKEVSEVLEEISVGVSKKVTGDVKPIVDEIITKLNKDKKKYETVESAIETIEKEIKSSRDGFINQLKNHTDSTNNVINKFNRHIDSSINKISQAVNTVIHQKVVGLENEVKSLNSVITSNSNNLDNYFKHIEKQQELLLKRSNVTFIVLGIIIFINIFLNIIR